MGEKMVRQYSISYQVKNDFVLKWRIIIYFLTSSILILFFGILLGNDGINFAITIYKRLEFHVKLILGVFLGSPFLFFLLSVQRIRTGKYIVNNGLEVEATIHNVITSNPIRANIFYNYEINGKIYKKNDKIDLIKLFGPNYQPHQTLGYVKIKVLVDPKNNKRAIIMNHLIKDTRDSVNIASKQSASKNITFVNKRTRTKENTDSVKIVSVTPDTDLIDGKEQSFIVKINYNLSTQKHCYFDIGFNTVEVGFDGFKSSKQKDIIVKKGSGNLTFRVTTIPKNWFSEGEFYVKVGLYIIKKFEWPRKELGMKLAGDSKALLFNNENNSLVLTQTDRVENFKENFETNDFMFCINCGTKIAIKSNFCISCGFNLTSVKG